MPAWNPLVQQVAEADTLLLADLTDLASLNASGGRLEADIRAAQSSNVAGYTFGAGKFTPSIKPLGTPSPSKFFYWPVDGLLAGDQFTVEFWAMHPTLNWQDVNGKTLAEIRVPTLHIPLAFTGAGTGMLINWEILPHTAGKISRQFSVPEASLNFAAGVWVSVALVKYPDHTLRCLLNGVDVGGVTTFDIPQLVSDDLSNTGLRFGGTDGGASGFAISDIRVSRTARTVGATPTLKSLTGTLAIDAADVAGTIPDGFLGCLHGAPTDTPAEDVAAVMKVMRTNKHLTATPIKAGGTDATHPMLGHSGEYSYDWQVADRSLNLIAAHGAKAWISMEVTVNLLGGTVAPYSGAALTDPDHLSYSGNDARTEPNDLAAWVTIVSDYVHHVIDDLDVEVHCWSMFNEPDGGFWEGTRAAFMDHYDRTMTAVRSADATNAPIIGAELVSVYGNEATWVNDLIAKHVATGVPLDGFTYHDYKGDLRYVNDAQALLDEKLVANGLAAGSIPLWIGEFNAGQRHMPTGAESDDPQDDYIYVRAFVAAYTTAWMCNALATTNVQGVAYSHITTIDQYGPGGAFGYGQPGDPRNLGFALMQLIGPDGEHWAPYNAMKGLQMVLGDERLTIDADLPPGVHAYAGRDSTTGRVGIALANYGWAALADRDVAISFDGLAAGDYRVRRYLVDPTHSSRWDTFEDDPGGEVDDDLELMSHTLVGDAATLDVTVPQWGSVFITLDPFALPRAVVLNGAAVLLA